MTGIAFGNLDIPKISMGDTPIVKVSMGDTLVWPMPVATLDSVSIIQWTSSATTAGAPFPSQAQVGDAIVFIERCVNTAMTGTPPVEAYPELYTAADFTSQVFDTVSRMLASYKVLDQFDIDNANGPILGMTGNSTRQRIAFLVRGYADGVPAPIGGVSWFPAPLHVISDGNPNPITFPIEENAGLTAATPQHLSIGVYAATGAAPSPRTWTGPTPEEANAGTFMYANYVTNFVGMTNFQMDMVDEGTSNTLYALTPFFGST